MHAIRGIQFDFEFSAASLKDAESQLEWSHMEDKMEQFWDDLFREQGKEYVKPHLVLFTDQTRSACGFADAAPFPDPEFGCFPGFDHLARYMTLSLEEMR